MLLPKAGSLDISVWQQKTFYINQEYQIKGKSSLFYHLRRLYRKMLFILPMQRFAEMLMGKKKIILEDIAECIRENHGS